MPDVRCAWIAPANPGEHPITHQVTLHDAVERRRGFFTGAEATTDCGIKLTPPTELHFDKPITCTDCLFGGLDGMLSEFTRVPELVGAGGPPQPIEASDEEYLRLAWAATGALVLARLFYGGSHDGTHTS